MLDGQVAVVSGASAERKGAIADALAAAGAEVVALAAGDLADDRRALHAFAAFERVDVLVHTSALVGQGALLDASVEALRELLDDHVMGTFVAARGALRHMAARRRGHIVVVAPAAEPAGARTGIGLATALDAQRGLLRVLTAEARAVDVRVTRLYVPERVPPVDRSAEIARVVLDVLTRPGLAVEELTLIG